MVTIGPFQGDDDSMTDGGGAMSEDGAGQAVYHGQEDSGYHRGRHRWQYPDKYHDPKRRRGMASQPNTTGPQTQTPPAGHPQNNPFSSGSGRFPNSFAQQPPRNPNGPFVPGTGRFLPPLERKLQFPFKGNPHHRGFHWGPSAGQSQNQSQGGADTQERNDSTTSVHTFQSLPSETKTQWNQSHHQQRRNHGNRGNRGNRHRSRNRGRSPFDEFVPHEYSKDGPTQQTQSRARYAWYNPNPSSGQVEDGSYQNQQARQGFSKHQNQQSGYYLPPHRQASPPEKNQNDSGERAHTLPTTTPMET